jgi:hypothetical protein
VVLVCAAADMVSRAIQVRRCSQRRHRRRRGVRRGRCPRRPWWTTDECFRAAAASKSRSGLPSGGVSARTITFVTCDQPAESAFYVYRNVSPTLM